jgi:hypothetical protein
VDCKGKKKKIRKFNNIKKFHQEKVRDGRMDGTKENTRQRRFELCWLGNGSKRFVGLPINRRREEARRSALLLLSLLQTARTGWTKRCLRPVHRQ